MLREKKKGRMADTHLSKETTYIIYPICYTMMLPNMPFRKADAHPLRLNTRCKDLTLVPSMGNHGQTHNLILSAPPGGSLKEGPQQFLRFPAPFGGQRGRATVEEGDVPGARGRNILDGEPHFWPPKKPGDFPKVRLINGKSQKVM